MVLKVYTLSVSSAVFIYKRLITLNYRLPCEKSSTFEMFIILRGGKVNTHEAIKRNNTREQTCLDPRILFLIPMFLGAIINEKQKYRGMPSAKKFIHVGGET